MGLDFLALALAIVGIVYFRWAIIQRKWPTAPAHIDSVHVVQIHTLSAATGTNPWYWEVRRRYHYTVHGKRYSQNQFRTGELGSDWDEKPEALAKARQLREKKQITIRYDPADPADAVMEPQELTAILPLLGGLVLAALGLRSLVADIRKRRAEGGARVPRT
jgi:hypothetical protein